MSNPTAGWEKVGDSFYRKVKLYDGMFDQDLELENHIISGAVYSGAIALFRDQDKLHAYRPKTSGKSSIDVYSCAGNLVRRLNWDKGSIRGLGWSVDEQLLVVTEDGTVRCYYDLQGDFTQFSLGNGAEEHGVVACRFWSHGLVALLSNNHLIAVSNYNEPRPKLLAIPPSDQIHAWAIIPPAHTLSRSVEVLLAIDQTIYLIDSTDAEDRVLPNGPFKHISISPNGQYITLYTEDGKVWVITSDFQNKIGEHESKTKTVPKDVQWCGNDSVLLAWEDEVHMVGPNGAILTYYYDGWVHLLPDIDGVRLITNDVCEFLQKVPDASEEIFRIGSTSPASVLLDAIEQLEKKSPKADENIQLIKPNLPDAIAVCIEAAGQEFDLGRQKKLLKAASYGKSVLDLYSPDEFVEMCEKLRILNSLRDYKIGMPLTGEQYEHLTPEKVIPRLMSRREYLLAIRLSDYLRLPTNKIFVHWASQKVRNSLAEENVILDNVVSRVSSRRGISFETVARAAYDEGRGHLATQLLNHESRAGKQVPLLLAMSEDELALEKAMASSDTDLVYFVLLQMKKTLPLASFFRVLTHRPLATALVESSARHQDQSLLKDLYYQDDRRLDGANHLFSEALAQTAPQTKADKLKLAAKLLADNTKDPNAALAAKAIQEAQSLIRQQTTLDNELPANESSGGTNYTGLSVNQTIRQLILHSQSKRAHKVAIDFAVPPRVFEWVRLRALVAARKWNEVEEIAAKNKKSPIGWEPYFNEIFGAGNTKLAGGLFVAKCTTLTARERAELWVKCGMISRAGEELVKAKDLEGLEQLKDKVGASGVVEVERMVAAMKMKR